MSSPSVQQNDPANPSADQPTGPWLICLDCARFTPVAGTLGRCGLKAGWFDGECVRRCKEFA